MEELLKNESDENFVKDINKDKIINICDVKIGDIVYIEYITMSQKYIDSYPPVYGKIFCRNENGVYLYFFKDGEKKYQEIELPGCGYFGSRCYEYTIYLQ